MRHQATDKTYHVHASIEKMKRNISKIIKSIANGRILL